LLHRPGGTINLYSEIGMVLLLGLVTKNSILLVEYANQLKAKGLDTVAAVLESGRIRLRPILMTSVSTIMGAIPVMIGVGAGSTSRRPLGYAIVGGIFFSTVFTVFLVPAVSVETDATKNLPAFFNFGTLKPETYSVQAQVTLRYDLFTGGQKVAELSRSAAALDGAHAGELQARFAAALLTEQNYYAVLAGEELVRVARERRQRAEQQLAVGRARVVSGAAVQTDSLQLRLELSQAREALLREQYALRVARLTLGSRVGAVGPVDAAPLDSVLPADLPLTLDAAVE